MAENINNIPTVETSSGNFGSTPPMTQDIGPNQNPMLNIPSSATNPANFSPDYQTVLDKIDFSPLTNMAYGPSPVNPETARLIEQAAIPINKVIQAPYNDLNSNYSGNVTGGSYNPGDLVQVQIQLLDIKTL
jgi:hypothetical protein